jgi:uncharacterized protein YndB with AHSA1/START domain
VVTYTRTSLGNKLRATGEDYKKIKRINMSDVILVIKKTFMAAPEKVYEAWTNPKKIVAWFGPEGFTNTIHTFEVKEGGKYRITMKAPDNSEHTVYGIFKKLNPPNGLSMTWRWEGTEDVAGMSGETLVTVAMEPISDGTEMTLTHTGFIDDEAKQNHEEGWTGSFNKLIGLLK